jgi:3-deoxy-D-manno-octulosonate 8-phosphate phosphatase (KDO 8-P phosphatase)
LKISKEIHLKNEEILTMGDDLPDIHIMENSAIAACPENAVPEVKGVSDYISQKRRKRCST